MYATAHRVISPSGEDGINAFLHAHGEDFPWPETPWALPETEPGAIVRQAVAVAPGGNRVRSYLDVLAPDGTSPELVEATLDGLWLKLAAEERSPETATVRIPNPVVYRVGAVVVRFGMETPTRRARELAELRRHIEALTVANAGS